MFRGIKINSVSAREFFFFLLLTTIVATLIKLSKTYTTQYEVALAIKDVPLDRTVREIAPAVIKVSTEGSGFSLITNALENPEVDVLFNDLYRVSDREYLYSVSEHQIAIKERINGDISIISMTPREIKIKVDSVASKRVPVVSEVTLSYKTGYGAKNKMSITPDSITVVGPSLLLSEVSKVTTATKEITEINTDVSEEVALSLVNIPEGLRISENNVLLTQEVAKFTEGKISVPITILNDLNSKVKILPKTAEIIYLVELENFDDIVSSDFLVTCDYVNVTSDDAYLRLKIAKQPEAVKTARLINKQVKFIIVN